MKGDLPPFQCRNIIDIAPFSCLSHRELNQNRTEKEMCCDKTSVPLYDFLKVTSAQSIVLKSELGKPAVWSLLVLGFFRSQVVLENVYINTQLMSWVRSGMEAINVC